VVSTRHRALFASLFMSTGAALLIYIVSGVSLLAAATLALVGAAMLGAAVWHRSTAHGRADLQRSLRVGMVAGLFATAAYDLTRYSLVKATDFTFWPFDIFTIFGQALVGVRYEGPLVTVAGIAYHLANGVGFAVAYTVLLGRRGVWAGVLWAMMLETIMVSVYPGWLGLKALDEFLQVSILGHLAYGCVLGFTARFLLTRHKGP
jgi:hypothetical protein